MPTFLPQDSNENPIPALRLRNSGAHSITTSVSSARNAAAFDLSTRIVSLYVDQPVYIRFGDSTVTASSSDHYFPAGVYYDFSIGGDHTAHYTHMAALAVSTGGLAYISEKE